MDNYKISKTLITNAEMQEILLTTYCGLDCTNCEYKEPCSCRGCAATKGMPFHATEMPCPVAACAMQKELSFCGKCTDFPCQLLKDYSNDTEHGDNPPGARIVSCNEIKRLLEKK